MGRRAEAGDFNTDGYDMQSEPEVRCDEASEIRFGSGAYRLPEPLINVAPID